MLLVLLPMALADPPDAAPTPPDPFADCRQLPPELHGLGGEWSAGWRDLFAAVQTIRLDGAESAFAQAVCAYNAGQAARRARTGDAR